MKSQIENLTSSEIVKNHENRVSKVETVFSHRPGITVRDNRSTSDSKEGGIVAVVGYALCFWSDFGGVCVSKVVC